MANVDLQENLRRLPSVDSLLQRAEVAGWTALYGQDLVVDAIRVSLDSTRRLLLEGAPFPGEDAILSQAGHLLDDLVTPSLVPVINATGVILHTNLGRAPLSASVLNAMRRAGEGYSNLEFDLGSGRRGSRYVHAESLLCRLTGAEAALLVNNNAGAVLLMLSALARGREVLISRGQLVEIGGGFRIPDVMAQSGARLVEVGTTNRTYVRDYEAAITDETAAIMRVHSSNFRQRGFVAQPALGELVSLAREHDLLMLDDLGSGTLLETADYGLAHEPTIQESVSAGVDLLSVSGDKLLGGPQAGIIAGKADLVGALRRFPLTRALRVDKTAIAGLQANLLHYIKGEAEREIPIWRMISAPREAIAERARGLVERLGRHGSHCNIVDGTSVVGGGSLPDEGLATALVAVSASADDLATRLRLGTPAIVTRIEGDRVLLDLRTVLPGQEEVLAQRLVEELDA